MPAPSLHAVTTSPVLVFLDADVPPGPDAARRLAASTTPGADVSVQPWHDAVTAGERVTLLANFIAVMGCAAFTIVPQRLRADVAFGLVLAIERSPTTRSADTVTRLCAARSLTEDIALGLLRRRQPAVHRSPRRDVPHVPGGVAAVAGRVVTDDGRRPRPRRGGGSPLGVVAWMWSLAGGPFTGWAAYPLSALQVWVLGRRAGRVGPVLAALYPLLVVAVVVVVVRAGWLRAGGATTWKGRPVPAA